MNLIRPLVQKLKAYVPGEQPRLKGLVKLNTNENPYPPSPKAIKALKAAADERLRLYPDPTAGPLREKLAKLYRYAPENIIVGNGSDELLALATRAFVEPATGALHLRQPERCTVQYFVPSYSLYPVLAKIHGATPNPIPLESDFSLPGLARLRRGRLWDFRAALTFVTTPNAPTGTGYPEEELEALCATQKGIVVLDEAYAEFASGNALELPRQYPHVIIARTFSKAYSLCYQRVGYFIGHPDLIAALDRIRDSYNVNGLGQEAALAALSDLPYYRTNFKRVVTLRERLRGELIGLGFGVSPSETNFLFVRPPGRAAERWLHELRKRKILVRWFHAPETRDYLRITIGNEREINALLKAVRGILRED